MNKHCVSLELAKQLKEVGWEKETEFWWIPDIKAGDLDNTVFYRIDVFNSDSVAKINEKNYCPISAPLATEILEELPNCIEYKNYFGNLIIRRWGTKYKISYETSKNYTYEEDVSLPNALAKMWFYLKKEELK